MKILIVEDEAKLADVVSARLSKDKYEVKVCTDGNEGLDEALSGIYDLVILDIMLPGTNGIEILKEIRENKIPVKVIMLTAKSQLEDKLAGFNKGADDYLTKPFHLEELAARVNVQLRRNSDSLPSNALEFGDIKLSLNDNRLTCITTGEEIDIAGKEYSILEYFLNNPSQIISKDQLYNRIWGIDNTIESNNLEAYLSFIRKKMRIIGSKTNIKAVRGLGYKMEKPDHD